jgi:hypothetical protein
MNTQMKWKWMVMVGIGMGLAVTRAEAANTPADATITVTPVADVSLAISPTTYAYGALDVNTSSITASSMTLSNNGEVGVVVSKQITDESAPGGAGAWVAGTSIGTDQYVLWVTTAAARPGDSEFTVATRFGAEANPSSLTGAAGNQPTITVAGGALPSVGLWFKLDMPSVITNQTAREVTVRFTGTAN